MMPISNEWRAFKAIAANSSFPTISPRSVATHEHTLADNLPPHWLTLNAGIAMFEELLEKSKGLIWSTAQQQNVTSASLKCNTSMRREALTSSMVKLSSTVTVWCTVFHWTPVPKHQIKCFILSVHKITIWLTLHLRKTYGVVTETVFLNMQYNERELVLNLALVGPVPVKIYQSCPMQISILLYPVLFCFSLR